MNPIDPWRQFGRRVFGNGTTTDPLAKEKQEKYMGLALVNRIYQRSPWLMVREVHHIALNAAVRRLTQQTHELSSDHVARLQQTVKWIRGLIDQDQLRVEPFQSADLPQKVEIFEHWIHDELERLTKR